MTSGGRKRSVAGPGRVQDDPLLERLAQPPPAPHAAPREGRRPPSAPVARTAVSLPVAAQALEPRPQTVAEHAARRASNASSSITSSVASAAAATSGPPPKVDAVVAGAQSTSAASPPATQAPIGSPLASAFAAVNTSGRRGSARTPRACRCGPCRTGSRRKRAGRRLGRRPRVPRSSISSAIGQTPDSPWTGSIMTAAVRSAHGRSQRLRVVARHAHEAGHERRERLLLRLLRRRRQRSHRAPVEGPLEHDDLASAAVLARELDRRLVRLRARVARRTPARVRLKLAARRSASRSPGSVR